MPIRKLSLMTIAALLLSTSAQAQTSQSSGSLSQGSAQSQLCTDDPTYCSTGASPGTTTGSGTASSGGSGGGSSGGGSSGAGAGAPASIPNAPCGDGFPIDAWGDCN
jgi:hypothetical protein